MLPWPGRVGVAQRYRFVKLQRPCYIRDNAVVGEIAAAYYVAGTSCGYRFLMVTVVIRIEDRALVRSHYYFRRSLAGRVGVVAAQLIIFLEGSAALGVLIHLIG